MTALIAASTIAKLAYPQHPVARAMGWAGGNTTQPSFQFSKQIRAARTASGTATDYVAVTPNAANDGTDVTIKNGSDLTIGATHSTPDSSIIGAGSLFDTAAFASGSLEARCTGVSVRITPTGNRLNLGGVVACVLSHEGSLGTGTAFSALAAADRRTKRVVKAPARVVEFNPIFQNRESHTTYNTAPTVYGYGVTDPVLFLAIDADSGNAVNYLLEIDLHFEVIGTTVAGSVKAQPHHPVLHERIHHAAALHHTNNGAAHKPGPARAQQIAKTSTGFGFSDLIKLGGQAFSYGQSAISMGRKGLGMLESAPGFLGEVSSAIGGSAIGDLAPLVGEMALSIV